MLLKTKDAAVYSGLSRYRLAKLFDQGVLRGRRDGRERLYNKDALEDWIRGEAPNMTPKQRQVEMVRRVRASVLGKGTA